MRISEIVVVELRYVFPENNVGSLEAWRVNLKNVFHYRVAVKCSPEQLCIIRDDLI